MANELIPEGAQALPTQALDDKTLDALAGSGWMPRIQLMDSRSGPVSDGLIQQGNYGLVRNKKTIVNLSPSFEGLVLARRPKALRIAKDGITNVYDPSDAEFQKIEQQSAIKDSGCTFGTEFLVWIRTMRTWALFFCNSKTSRNASLDLINILKQWANKEIPSPQVLFKRYKADNNQFKWEAPEFVPVTAPFSENPPWDEIQEQVKKFLNPPKNEVESVSAVEARG